MTRKTGLVLFGIVSLVLLAPPTWAASVKTVNIQEMVQLSGTIFYGRCLSSADSVDPVSGLGIRTYRFLVLEPLKNTESGQVVEFRQIGASGKGYTIPGVPEFRKGQELLLFLHGESKSGLTSPVGFQQGVFRAEALEGGELGFTNAYGNRNLSFQLAPEAQVRAGLESAEVRTLQSGEPVPLPLLRDIVVKLERYNDQIEGRVQ